MKVLFLVKSPKFPSSRIRIREIVSFLPKDKIEAEIIEIPQFSLQRKILFSKSGNYSVVVLQKELLSISEMQILRENSRFLIYDFDDAVYFNQSNLKATRDQHFSKTKMRKFINIVNNVDQIVAANRILAEKVSETAPDIPCKIIPSAVATGDQVKNEYALKNPPVIGWIGQKSNLKYLKLIAPTLQELSQSTDFKLRIIADGTLKIKGVNIEHIPWLLKTQYQEIMKFDIGIMPLADDPYSRGKSAYKLIQYMSLGIPSIASDVGINKDISNNAQNCLIYQTTKELIIQLKELLDNQLLREKIGKNGRKLVLQDLSLPKAAKAWKDLLLQTQN